MNQAESDEFRVEYKGENAAIRLHRNLTTIFAFQGDAPIARSIGNIVGVPGDGRDSKHAGMKHLFKLERQLSIVEQQSIDARETPQWSDFDESDIEGFSEALTNLRFALLTVIDNPDQYIRGWAQTVDKGFVQRIRTIGLKLPRSEYILSDADRTVLTDSIDELEVASQTEGLSPELRRLLTSIREKLLAGLEDYASRGFDAIREAALVSIDEVVRSSEAIDTPADSAGRGWLKKALLGILSILSAAGNVERSASLLDRIIENSDKFPQIASLQKLLEHHDITDE